MDSFSLNYEICHQARISRDVRFDGLFFTAVKTTGIYCRPICPAPQPLEKNVEYYASAVQAAQAGFRPCLRCRPDAAPHSHAWLGVQTSVIRALTLIDQGALQEGSVEDLAERLGITSRYLSDLFKQHMGVSPKQYAIYQQCLFAKQLLHQSKLKIQEIAFASGFNSVRRFNEAMQQQIGLSPSQIRKQNSPDESNILGLKLFYRPPFDWNHTLNFLSRRTIDGIEWVSDKSYGRTIQYGETVGSFEVSNNQCGHYLDLKISLNQHQDLRTLINRIRTIFDLDATAGVIDNHLLSVISSDFKLSKGLRIPGIWSYFEAGVRAILGQQVTVKQAHNLVEACVQQLGESITVNGEQRRLFPAPKAIVDSDLAFFKMPQARKDTLRAFAEFYQTAEVPTDIGQWLAIKGIGSWTANYARLRAELAPDVWLENDAGIKQALKLSKNLNPELAKPWRSYLVFQLWNQL